MCSACPWRDIDDMLRDWPDVAEHARTEPRGFVCHTRCVPCPGPRHFLRRLADREAAATT